MTKQNEPSLPYEPRLREIAHKCANDLRGLGSNYRYGAILSVLRSELSGLLDAADHVCDLHGEKHPTSCVHRLAEELAKWKR